MTEIESRRVTWVWDLKKNATPPGEGGGGNSTSEDKKKSLLLAKWNLSNVTHFNTQSQERDDDLIKISIQETLDLTYAQEFI